MGNKRWPSFALVFILFLCPLRAIGFAEQTKYEAQFEFLAGYGTGRIHEKGAYRLVPFFLDFNFDLRPWLEKHKINPPGLFAIVVEPFLSYVISPDSNIEVGNNFAIKIGFLPETSRLQPYFKGGSGPIFISQHTREQGSQFNFDDFAALGVHYFFKKTSALTFEYRYRHISNANLWMPNRGFENNLFLCGVSFSF